MAIGFRAAGTVATTATNSMIVSAPAGLASTDISFLSVSIKPYSLNITTPDGWLKIIDFVNGSTVSGLDTGSVRTVVFKRFGIYTDTTVNLAGTATVAEAGIVAYTRSASETWAVKSYTTGFDASHGANYSATGGGILQTATNNWLLSFTGLNTDAGTLSSILLAETSATFGTQQTRINSGTTTGDDMRLLVHDAPCTAGTGSAAPSLTFTNASSSSGGTVFLRLAVVTASVSVTALAPFDDTAGYQITVQGIDNYHEYEVLRKSTFTDVYPQEFVRGGQLQAPGTATSTVIQDYEFHFSDLDSTSEDGITYIVNFYLDDVLQDSIVSSSNNPVLDRSNASGFGTTSVVTFVKDCFNPIYNVLAVIEDFKSFSKEGRVLSTHNVLGKKNPIVITDVSSGMSGSFRLLVVGVSGFTGGNGTLLNKKVEDLLNRGDTYYFQSIFPYVVGIPDFYFQVENYTYERLNRIPRQAVARASDLTNPAPIGVWEIKWVEVDRPAALDVAVSATIWGSPLILSTWATWQGVKDNNVNWLDIIE